MIIAMEHVFIVVGLALFGLIIGSFSGATVWRLRARQLKEDKAAGEHVNAHEYARLKTLLSKSVKTDRSVCLHCHHTLKWYDLIPLVSWVALRGKCRYCRKPIGWFEPLIELGMAFFFVVSYLAWYTPLTSPLAIFELGLWLVVGAGLIMLFVYDAKWFLLPNRIIFPLIGLASIAALVNVIQAGNIISGISGLLISVAILSGLYYVLYVFSQGKWIGFGDIKLGIVLALMLTEWPLAFLTLFLANVIGCLIVLPGLLTKKLKRTSHVPFGPMLILAYFIAGLFGPTIIVWYLNAFTLQ